MSIVLVIAPHPDDETLGCGGSLLRHKAEGDDIHWLIMSRATKSSGFTEEKVKQQKVDILSVAESYPFKSFYQTKFEATRLDTIPKIEVINEVSAFLNETQADTLYLPYPKDAHSDHKVVFDAAAACTKSFRFPFVRKIRVYETLSETEFGLQTDLNGFQPNLFINISDYLSQKISIMNLYHGEMQDHPFPRSEKNISSLATLRGATAGWEFAEAFISLKEIN